MLNLTIEMLTDAVAGQGRSVDALVAELRPMVVRFCSPRLPNRSDIDADDVAQEVLLAIVRMFPTFEVRSIGQFVSAVLVVAQRKVVDVWRLPRRDVPCPVEHLDMGATYASPDRIVAARAELAALAGMLGALPAHQRTVTRMRAEGMQAVEVGRALRRPASWVRATHCRAVARLRDSAGDRE